MKSIARKVNLVALTLLVFSLAPHDVASAAEPAAPQKSSVVAQLVIPDAMVLPGVPFEMWIELRNTSEKLVGVGTCADMVVTPEGGEPFTISFGGEERPPYPTLLPSTAWNSAPVPYVTLKPRQTQTLTLPILPELSGPLYFADPRLSPPGRYAIALRLGYCWPPFTTPQKKLVPRDFAGAIETNTATVERISPVGADAVVWHRMQEVTGGHWVSIGWLSGMNAGKGRDGAAGRTVVDEILTKYRDSNYYPYALLAASFGAARNRNEVARLTDAIDRFPTSPVLEMLHEEVLGLTNAACGLKGHAMAAACGRANAVVNASKRPTTRIRAFGRADVAPPPCSPDEECID